MWWIAAAFAGTGPHEVVVVDRAFDDPVARRVDTRIYRPDAPGAYPLAVFLHGWLGAAWMYDDVCDELASWGYVVVSLDTETGLVLDMEAFADDAVAALHAVDAASADPADVLAGTVSAEPWTILGHSMGGATLHRVLGLEPRLDVAVAFMPYVGPPAYHRALAEWTGSYLLLSGTADTTAPVALQQEWFADVAATRRSLWTTVDDMGHQGITDLNFEEDPLPDAVQHEVLIRWSAAFVRAERTGDEDLWEELVGAGADGVTAVHEARSAAPVLVGDFDDLAVVGHAGAEARLWVGGAPGADGVVADRRPLDTWPLGEGVARGAPPAVEPGDWVQVEVDGPRGAAWTRALPLGGAAPPDPTDPEPPGDDEPDPLPDEDPPGDAPTAPDPAAGDAAGSGCATAPAPAWLALVALAALAARRPRW
jgi:dienelactone hydrolase